MSVPVWVWVATLAAIVGMLAADMRAHRAPRRSTMALALRWSAAWVGLGAGFGMVVWAAWGPERAGEYFAGYLLEKSLSVDNVLLFALIFAAFAVPRAYQHRVLFLGVLGVLGALALRAVLIAAGAALLDRFAWVTYVFGGVLLLAALRIVRSHGGQAARQGGRLIRRVIRSLTSIRWARSHPVLRRPENAARWRDRDTSCRLAGSHRRVPDGNHLGELAGHAPPTVVGPQLPREAA